MKYIRWHSLRMGIMENGTSEGGVLLLQQRLYCSKKRDIYYCRRIQNELRTTRRNLYIRQILSTIMLRYKKLFRSKFKYRSNILN